MANKSDPTRLSLRRAARVGVMVPIGYWVASGPLNLGGDAAYSVFAIVVLLAFSDFQGRPIQRLKLYLLAGMGGMLLIAVGALCSQREVIAVIGAFVFSFAVLYLSVLRGFFATASRGLLLALAMSIVTWHMTAEQFVGAETGWGFGVIMSVVGALVLWPARPPDVYRKALAEGLDAAADAVGQTWLPPGGQSDPARIEAAVARVKDAHDKVHSAYDGALSRPGAATARDRGLMQLVDQLGGLRLSLAELGSRPSPEPDGAPEAELAAATEQALAECGKALRAGAGTVDVGRLSRARDAERETIMLWADNELAVGHARSVVDRVRRTFELRVISLLAEMVCLAVNLAQTGRPVWARHKAGRPPRQISVTVETRPTKILAGNLDWSSPWLRNSMRSAGAIALAVAVVALTGAPVGFWVVLGAIMAIRFSAVGTGKTALAAIAGTVLGLGIGSGLILAVGDRPAVYWALFPIAAFAATYTIKDFSFILSQAAFSVLLLTAYALIAGPRLQTAEVRLVDVTLGVASSLVMSVLMWPRGIVPQVTQNARAAIGSSCAFLSASLDRILGGQAFDQEAAVARREAMGGIQTALEAFDLSLSQPGQHAVDAHSWTIIANAASQIYVASNSLLHIPHPDFSRVPCPELADDMIATGHSLRATLVTSTVSLESLAEGEVEVLPGAESTTRPFRDGLLADPIPHLRDGMDVCLDRIARAPAPGLGPAIVTLLWVEAWLVHMRRICSNVERIQPTARARGTADPAGQAR